MPADTLDLAFIEQHVAQAKAAWRKHAQSKTWEEKIAAIERMWERDAELKKAREANAAQRRRSPVICSPPLRDAGAEALPALTVIRRHRRVMFDLSG